MESTRREYPYRVGLCRPRGTLPGALLQTLVAQQANAFADQGGDNGPDIGLAIGAHRTAGGTRKSAVMSVGAWVVSATLSGLFLILWGTNWLEHLLAPPALDPTDGCPRGSTRFTNATVPPSFSGWMARSAPEDASFAERTRRNDVHRNGNGCRVAQRRLDELR